MATQQSFLETIKTKGNLKDLKEARHAAEVVYRSMRDVMPNEAVDRVSEELDETPDVAEDLWTDTNPLVYFLSRLRPQLDIKPENFLVRLRQEANLPGADAETIIKAVFSATKEELSQERAAEIAEYLPGEIGEFWNEA
ncbi:DUF2267 domain-containing protein [Pseudanabaena sp. FACHB-2040]|uniref:DUF2267 domain-containing protein n=1 Tax=Pseudanabaena sp. FACHB-2040 TaxID=2692859 RepID=UPI00168985C9|nr:DUF2267 domain-containing protein [Pseudanabaena sp. FACHB-2040]MBD2256629.1 DUF2267 domain-containing protein [Pseudanabaena sp. FACHB-2040]